MTDPTADPDAPASPEDLPPSVEQLVRGTRSAEELAARLTGGRKPRSRLLHEYQVPRVDEPGFTLLRTSGPVLGRDLELIHPESHRLVATCTELVVLSRLPEPVAAALRGRAEGLHQVLDSGGASWRSQLVRALFVPGGQDPGRGRATQPAAAVQILRRIWIGSAQVTALISEEYRLDQDQLAAPGGAGLRP